MIKLLPRLEEYVEWKEMLSMSVCHNDCSNVSTLEKKTHGTFNMAMSLISLQDSLVYKLFIVLKEKDGIVPSPYRLSLMD